MELSRPSKRNRSCDDFVVASVVGRVFWKMIEQRGVIFAFFYVSAIVEAVGFDYQVRYNFVYTVGRKPPFLGDEVIAQIDRAVAVVSHELGFPISASPRILNGSAWGWRPMSAVRSVCTKTISS